MKVQGHGDLVVLSREWSPLGPDLREAGGLSGFCEVEELLWCWVELAVGAGNYVRLREREQQKDRDSGIREETGKTKR